MTDGRRLRIHAPAKINLFLHITGRRDDGYHNLQTVFQLLDIGDSLVVETNRSGVIALDGPDLGIADSDNLVVRAAMALKALPGTPEHCGATIRLEKQLPSGGGLGGGSSDAASTLLALNALWGLRLSTAALQRTGAALGADVPVFVLGRSAWAEGIGEQLTPLDLPPAWYLVLKPDCAVHTGEIFSHRQLTRDTPPITMHAFFAGDSRNDCEPIVRQLYPEVDNALNWLQNFGEARLTGTGACIFCRCGSEVQARRIAEQVPARWKAWVAAGINRSPAVKNTELLL
ncbi:4-(cytidine 5'-diphospho)-2-C-methyl-D-erythritol kinase [Chromatocurvus halotolerans]|uniref:4-diphosphocytidyl-2-C-methyl-D-erythritol kinase n=1 Tax=Chromatocurvus halotolerans TaxID=1132028 RepID=A0A4R2KRE6_9GAMM|nr:4-(cytidine 5'-diphospho)-2-C-methyl-D-erythritol kinase [Chromatocurvus halotolerans]TCO76254.1 4-diphosphocytidyl-2-C-methyl-D-erythritol kinase [Chromatocurvus halotolerans]